MSRMQTLLPLAMMVSLVAAGQAASRSTDLRIRSGGVELAATLTLPDGAGPHPAVILMHGSGPGTRTELRRFAAHFESLGYATLVYDKRGSGQSTGSWTTASLEDSVADARSAFERLQEHSAIDRARIGVWGVSQAGWFIPVFASRTPSLAFAIVLTGGGATPREVEMFMHRQSLQRLGATADEHAEAEKLLQAYFDWLGSGVGRGAVVELVTRAKGTRWFATLGLDRVMPSDANRPNWAWVATFDPAPFIEKMTVPTLVVLGGADLMGSAVVASERWTAALARAGNQRAKVVTIAGMGHAATIGSAHEQGGAIMPAYLAEVAAFVKGRAPSGRFGVSRRILSSPSAELPRPSRLLVPM